MPSFKKNVALNVAGSIVPLLIAIVTVPLYLKSIGATRYGILTLVWLFAGYFSLLDFGISRATVNLVAKVAPTQPDGQRRILWSALWINLAVGLIGMCLIYPVAHYVFGLIRFDDPAIREELVQAIPWLCLTVPLMLVSAVLQGGLEARERFDLVNLLGVLGGLLTQVLPVFVAYQIGVQLNYLILAIVVGRTVSFVLLWIVMRRAFPLGRPLAWDRQAIGQLLSFGGWASISGVVSPLLDALDRFVIGAKVSASDVAMYAIPFSIADKLRIVPRALARAAYPRLSSLPDAQALALYHQLIKGSLNLMTPIVLGGIFASKHLMELWIGVPQDSVSGVIAIVLLCGAWFNSMALIPFVYIQSRGRPNVTAVIHMIELLPFIGLLFALVHWFGVVGAALAWSSRMMADCLLLCACTRDGDRGIVYRLLAHSLLLMGCAYWMAHRVLSWTELGVIVAVLGLLFFALNGKTLRQLLNIKRGIA